MALFGQEKWIELAWLEDATGMHGLDRICQYIEYLESFDMLWKVLTVVLKGLIS